MFLEVVVVVFVVVVAVGLGLVVVCSNGRGKGSGPVNPDPTLISAAKNQRNTGRRQNCERMQRIP